MKATNVILFICLFTGRLYAQNNNYTEIYGSVEGVYYSKMYLFFEDEYRKRDSISSEITNGKFYFKINHSTPVLGRLHLDQTSYLQDVYLEGPLMNISCRNDIKKLRDTLNMFSVKSVTGSKTEELKRNFEDWLDTLKNSGLPEEEINTRYYNKLKTFVEKNPSSKVSPYLVSKAGRLPLTHIHSLNSLIAPTLQNTFEEKEVQKLLSKLDKQQNASIGNSFKDFTVIAKDGSPKHISDFKGKYLFIVLWASWCNPCRMEHPAINEYYSKINNKELEILGISIDKDKNRWIKAMEDDHLTWSQALDEKSEINNYFGISSIPFNILLDKNGKIIGWNNGLETIETLIKNRESVTQ